MSNIENERLLENLYEKYLDLGYDSKTSYSLALKEIADLQ
jgi:hypothetical protein